MFDAVIMLKALTTVLEMTEPMLKKILPFTVEEHLEVQRPGFAKNANRWD